MCTNRSDFDCQDVIYMLQYVDVILGSRCSRRVSGVYHFISSLSSAQYGSGYRTVNMFTWHGMNILKVSAPFMQKPHSVAMAAGMMIAASIGLVVEGYLEDPLSSEGSADGLLGSASGPARLAGGCLVRVSLMNYFVLLD